MLRIGTAGWTIPTLHASQAPEPGTHLERYARVLSCVEINSSFYRSHRLTTWAKWAASTPEDFRFSVKFPKAITHTAKLTVAPEALDSFFAQTAALGERLGTILIQLAPSLRFEDCPAPEFFEALRDRYAGPVALEPRHGSWFGGAADEVLARHRISRVAADPVRQPNAAVGTLPQPGGWPGLVYYRLHGSPRTYYSSYTDAYLETLAAAVASLPARVDVWVVFDNTALGHAFTNALALRPAVAAGEEPRQKKGRDRSRAR